jgi:hypothetical protein
MKKKKVNIIVSADGVRVVLRKNKKVRPLRQMTHPMKTECQNVVLY